MYPIRVFSVVRDLTRYNCWCVSSVNTTVVPDFTTLYSWMRWNYVPPHPAYQPAASSVHHTTSCKHSLVLLRIDEIIARNMLSCLELLINRYCCICLVVYIIGEGIVWKILYLNQSWIVYEEKSVPWPKWRYFRFLLFCSHLCHSGFVGLEVSYWPLVPKFAGSNPAEAVGFLRVNKNPQHVGGHGCLSVVIVVCCQVEVSATNWSLVQRSPTDCGASLCVI